MKRKFLRTIGISFLFLSLLAGTQVHAEDQVLTLYFCGTGIKSDAYEAANSAWHQPELLCELFRDDSSHKIKQGEWVTGFWEPVWDETGDVGPHHRYILNGAGTSPEFNIFDIIFDLLGTADPNFGHRTWDLINYEAKCALELVIEHHSGEDVILNLVGYSRGGISCLKFANYVYVKDYPQVKKINILAYDPVPGGFDPIGSFGDDFNLSEKVNQYVALYADHERAYMFEPVIPQRSSNTTKMLMVRVPGSHETLVGNRQVDGHSITFLQYNTQENLEDQGYEYVSIVSKIIAHQLLTSVEWGNVPLDTGYGGVDTRNLFENKLNNMWAQDYQSIPSWSFYPAFGTYDLCYASMGRNHHLRFVTPLSAVYGRLCFIAPYRHASEWAWCWCPPWYIWFGNAEQVYWLNDIVPAISGNTWDILQSFRGDPPLDDTTPPVPNLAALPTMICECSASITTSPTATDNTAGMVTGTTPDPLYYSELGEYTITWLYDDGNGNISTQEQTVIVQDTMAPLPDEETLPTVQGECSAAITSIPNATDNCSGTIAGTTDDPLVYTKKGTYTVTWVYHDGNGNIETQPQTVIVTDTTPPVLNPVPDKSSLWPPNHKMVDIVIKANASDNCGPPTLSCSVASNEPTAGAGKGDKSPDWTEPVINQETGAIKLKLRAERNGNGNGRVYTITITAEDNSGNSSQKAAAIIVPHEKKK
jgi:hypothetical protein